MTLTLAKKEFISRAPVDAEDGTAHLLIVISDGRRNSWNYASLSVAIVTCSRSIRVQVISWWAKGGYLEDNIPFDLISNGNGEIPDLFSISFFSNFIYQVDWNDIFFLV